MWMNCVNFYALITLWKLDEITLNWMFLMISWMFEFGMMVELC